MHSAFPDVKIFNNNLIPLEELGLDPEKDKLEYEKEFDRLVDEYYIKIDRLMISITFPGILYYERKYLQPDYYYLKAIKILLEFIERLESGEYPNNSITNTEIISELKQEGITMNNTEFHQFFLALQNETSFFRYISIQTQDKVQAFVTNKTLLTSRGRAFLESWRDENEVFKKVTDQTQKQILLEEYSLLRKIIHQGAWKDACIKIGGILEYLLGNWLKNKQITPSQILNNKKVKKWKDVKFYQMIEFYMNNSKKFEDEIGSYTDWNLVKNVLKDYRNYIHLEKYEERVRKGDVLRKKEFDRIYPIFQDIVKKF